MHPSLPWVKKIRAKYRSRRAGELVADRSPWDWYAKSCPCPGAPGPGECHVHPRARESQRPPASDWRVWSYALGRRAGVLATRRCS
jgi:hypothetical protein